MRKPHKSATKKAAPGSRNTGCSAGHNAPDADEENLDISNGELIDPDVITGLNPRQELFCQHIALGQDAGTAYKLAGYEPGKKGGAALHVRAKGDMSPHRASTYDSGQEMLSNPRIRARIRVLHTDLERRNEELRRASQIKWAVDTSKVTQMLAEDRHFARTGELNLRDENNNRTDGCTGVPPEWRPDARAAVQATMGIAKLHGLLVDRKEVTVVDAMQNMNNDELMEMIERMQAQLGPLIDVPVSSAPTAESKYSREITAQDILTYTDET
jgi:hypothetical protein